MKTFLATALTASAMATAAMGLAGQATAAPSGPSAVTSTVDALESHGFNVILNRTGAGPLSQCAVSRVRPGQEVTRTDSGFPGDNRSSVVVSKTVHVDVKC